ncbi:MAG: hypothetical protein V4585_08490 [Bacteroidota bacterium]
MKKAFITSAILLFVQIAIFAQVPLATTPDSPSTKTEKGKGDKPKKDKQPKMSAADRAVQYSNQLKSSLSLNDAQYQKVLAVNTECITRKDAMKGNQDHEASRLSKEDIKTYRSSEFQKIFTADQFTTYQNLNKKGGNDGEHGKGKDDDQDGDKKGKKEHGGHGGKDSKED